MSGIGFGVEIENSSLTGSTELRSGLLPMKCHDVASRDPSLISIVSPVKVQGSEISSMRFE